VPDLDPGGAETAHLLAEAGRLAIADRDRYLADTDFVPVPVAGLLAPDYLGMRAQMIDPDHAMASPRGGNPSWDIPPAQPAQPEHGTSQIVAIDAQGDAVSLTTTIGESFGSGILVDGFLLNTALADFSFVPAVNGRPVANRLQPGKRSRSSAAPVFVLSPDGRLQAALGSSGGADMPAYVTQVLLGLLDWKLDPGHAVALPHVTVAGNTVRIEAGPKAADLAAALRARGHDVSVQAMPSGTMVVTVTPNGFLGAADPRSDGTALANQ
jgi:gamma-glutamyltranspeptidase/glutathione hydrolase